MIELLFLITGFIAGLVATIVGVTLYYMKSGSNWR